VTRRLNEDYVPPPKRPIGTFEGQGHRLGAVVPDVVGTPTPSSLANVLNPPGMWFLVIFPVLASR
jgi:UBX domain-containing protein 1